MKTITDHTYHKKFTYEFGEVICYETYVISNLLEHVSVNDHIASTILNDINNHYGTKKIVYISNRLFDHDVDPKVYELVNPKKIIGIAIVGTSASQREQAANEQEYYDGSFSFFSTMDSAISWALSFNKREL